jgi:hypothetical protein
LVTSRQVRRECGQGPENARPVGCREASAVAQTLIHSPGLVVLDSTHRCASLVGSAYASDDRSRLSGRERCRRRGAHARNPVIWGEVWSRRPDTAVFRVEGSLSVPSRQTPGNDSDEAKFRKPTPL